MTADRSKKRNPTLYSQWRTLDQQIRQWWDHDLHEASEAEVLADKSQTLLFLPHPYSSASGSHSAFPEMYGWDTFFINLGLLAHDRFDLVRGHILNQVHLIEEYGFVPNGNRSYYLTRSQPPMLAEGVWRYVQATQDLELARLAIPALEREYHQFWDMPPRKTPTGLATHFDCGDPRRREALAAEAESGRDFTAIYGGDVRRCVPLHTNAALIKAARAISQLYEQLGECSSVDHWNHLARERAQRLRKLCWSEEESTFLQYDWVQKQPLPYRSTCAFWVLWAEAASTDQAEKVVHQLDQFLQVAGLSFTDQPYDSPHSEYDWLQWGYPSGWPPEQIIAMEALDLYGYHQEAEEVAKRYLQAQINLHTKTGELWEKLNVLTGGLDLPTERYAIPPFHGWSSASVAVLGRRVFAFSN